MLNRLNRSWRFIATAICYATFGLVGTTVPWLALPFFYLWPGTLGQKQRRAKRLVHYCFKFYIYLMRFLGVLTWQVENLERLQRPGILVIANHPTLIDVIFLVAFMPHADCVVKGALRQNPAMRGCFFITGFIANDSGENLINGAEETLKYGCALIIFPEGTRTQSRTHNTPVEYSFQRGAANIAVRTQVDITPVTIHCDPPTLSKQHKWYYIPPKKVVMSLCVYPDIAVARYCDKSATVASRQLTRDLEGFYNTHQSVNPRKDSS
jgi:1-acyl-sn-glycerol-3-phosphate acyltransferase